MARNKGKGPDAKHQAAEKPEGKEHSEPKTTDGKISQAKGTIAPEHFHGRFVKQRKPVVLQGQLEDLTFVTKNWANVEYLRKTAGDAKVKVEPMHKEKRRYGTDVQRVDTTFGAFLDSLMENKDEYDYLTTQYSDDEEDDDDDDDDDEDNDGKDIKNGTFPEPVRTLLQKDVPLRPALMGDLVLQQMNLWLGKSKTGASSGLHHDFHDNLYVLLKGRKRFVLYPPTAVEHLNTYGQVKKIHPNGLIVYKRPGEEDIDEEDENEGDEIRSDGLVQRDAAALKVQALEEKIALFKETGKKKGLDKLEKQHEEAIDEMMKYQIDDFQDLDDDDDDEDEEDEDEELKDQVLRDDATNGKKRKADQDLDARASKIVKADDESSEDEDDDDFAFGADGEGDDDSDADLLEALEKAQNGQVDDDSDSDADLLEALVKAQNGQGPSEPLSFSQISAQELHQHLGLASPKKTSPALEKAGTPYIVDLKAGDMLYLPTSWFHEVTSFSDKGDDVHIALNFWFHPPNSTSQKFDDPYEDKVLWKFMEEKVKSAYESLVAEK